MGSVYKNADALDSDFKKIEGRFRFKFGLTTENIELVLEDRIFKKTLNGKKEVEMVYQDKGGVIRGMGELANVWQNLPPGHHPGRHPRRTQKLPSGACRGNGIFRRNLL